MIEVTVGGRHATAGKDAGGVAGFDVSALVGGRPPSGEAAVQRLSGLRVGDGVSPLAVFLLFGDLSGNVGDNWSVTGEFAGMIGQAGQGVEIDLDFDTTAGFGRAVCSALKKVEEHVGTELIDGAGLARGSEPLGEVVDVGGDGCNPIRW